MTAPLSADIRALTKNPLFVATISFVQKRGISAFDSAIAILNTAADELDDLYDEVARMRAIVAEQQSRIVEDANNTAHDWSINHD